MANKLLNISIWALVWAVTACGPSSFDTVEDMWVHLRDSENGYQMDRTVNGVEYSLTYKPTDLLVAQELGQDHSKDKVAELREKYGRYLYFNLSMGTNGHELLNQKAGDRAGFGAMVNQLAFGMDQKLNLITQELDTVPLLDYIYPRMYGMGRSTDMLLVFERDPHYLEQEGYLKLTIGDLGLGTGEVALKIDSEKIKDEPKLKF